jgi:hypothetical protein
VYSADASWTSAYKLGILTLAGSDPLDAAAWKKSATAFTAIKNADGSVYGPGHNSSPVPSPDGSQFWLVYHAKALEKDGWEDREIALRPFTWNADNTPNLMSPVPDTVAMSLPAGEPCGLRSAWTFDAALVDNQGNTADTKGNPVSIESKHGKSVRFNGTTDYLDLNGAILTTTGSYSISACVKLSKFDSAGSIVSQEGGITSEFVLSYGNEKRFAFSLFNPTGDVAAQVVSDSPVYTGEWIHLVAVRDGLGKEIQLYVNGKLQDKKPFNGDWNAKGHTIVGAARRKTQRVDYFSGTIDNVYFYNSVLSEQDVQNLETQTC